MSCADMPTPVSAVPTPVSSRWSFSRSTRLIAECSESPASRNGRQVRSPQRRSSHADLRRHQQDSHGRCWGTWFADMAYQACGPVTSGERGGEEQRAFATDQPASASQASESSSRPAPDELGSAWAFLGLQFPAVVNHARPSASTRHGSPTLRGPHTCADRRWTRGELERADGRSARSNASFGSGVG